MAVDRGMTKTYCWACGLETLHSRIFFTSEGHKAYVHSSTGYPSTACETKALNPRHGLLQSPPSTESIAEQRTGILYTENEDGFDRPLPEWDHLVERVN
jgi:hypothetical protein